MIPAVMCFPVASITVAFLSERSLPILAIFPSLINTSVFSRIPSPSLVQTVAFLNSKVSDFGFSLKPNARLG